MPRESMITLEQVGAAADAIKAAGGRPSARNVREQLGQGSMGTVHRMLQQLAGQVPKAETTMTLPPALQRALLDFLGQEVTAAKTALEADLAESRQAAADLAAENERQADLVEDQVSVIDVMSADNASQRGKIEQLDAEAIRVRAEASLQIETAQQAAKREQEGREAAQVALAKAELRLEALPRLEKEIERLQAALDVERTARTDAERQQSVAEAKAAGLADRLADVQDHIREQKQRAGEVVTKLETDKGRLSADLVEAHKQARAAGEQVADLRTQLAKVMAQAEACADQVSDLRGQLVEARASKPDAKGKGKE